MLNVSVGRRLQRLPLLTALASAAAAVAMLSGCAAVDQAAGTSTNAIEEPRAAKASPAEKARQAALRAERARALAAERQAHAKSEARIAAARSLAPLDAETAAQAIYLGGHKFLPETDARRTESMLVFGWRDELETPWLVFGTPEDQSRPVTLMHLDKYEAKRVWVMTMTSLSAPPALVKSRQSALDVDCRTHRIRLAFLGEYADYWALGAPKLGSVAGARWLKPEPGSTRDDAWTLVCGKPAAAAVR